MARYTISSSALDKGVDECNAILKDMCGGEQLVSLNGFSWSYAPGASELTYTVRTGAPEKAIEFARRIHIRASFDNSFDVVEPERFDNWIYDLRQRASAPLEDWEIEAYEQRRRSYERKLAK
jgi:hypothetical protein